MTPVDRLYQALPWLYAIWALPLLIAVCWLMPPWQNADESAHFIRAEQVAHGHILDRREGASAGGISDMGIEAARSVLGNVPFHLDAKITRSQLSGSADVRWGNRQFMLNPNTAVYPPFFYIPQAFAIRFAQLADLPIKLSLRFARLANAIAAVTVTTAAIFFARRTRPLLLALAMLPMTMALFTSASQDALIIACTLLAVAILDRIAQEGRLSTKGEHVGLIALLAGIAMARPPYLAFALLIFLARRRLDWQGMVSFLAILLPAVAWTLLMLAIVSVPLNGNNPSTQFSHIVSHPGHAGLTILRTWWDSGSAYITEMIGDLGWLDAPVDPVFSSMALGIVVLCLICAAGGRARYPFIAFIAVTFGLIGLAAAQYLTWTKPGADSVEGIQGRYLTPPLAALALAAPGWPALSRVTRPAALAGLGLLAVLAPIALLRTIMDRYYLQ